MNNVTFISTLALAALACSVTASATADTFFSPETIALQEGKQAAVADVMVLFASNSGKGIDECAKHLKALSQPPLSSYDSYACLTEKKLPLQLNTSTSMATPDKGKLLLNLNKVMPRENKKPKYDLDVQVDKADGDKFVSTNVKAPQGKYFFLAGPKFSKDEVDGILVFAIQMQAP